MSFYDYEKGKQKIIDILDSKTNIKNVIIFLILIMSLLTKMVLNVEQVHYL